jgi:Domain of unknown function (DUF3885)
MSLKDQVIERFGNKAFSMRPTFHNNEGALRFELGVGDDPLSYKVTALNRFDTILDDLGFKKHPIGVAAYCFTYSTNEFDPPRALHCQLLPFARSIRTWGDMKFSRTEFLHLPQEFDSRTPEETGRYAYHFGSCAIDLGSLSSWLVYHLMHQFGVFETPLLMLFNLDLGIMINPYDDRGMDVFGPNRDLLKMLYDKRNDWLLDHNRAQMDAVYSDS